MDRARWISSATPPLDDSGPDTATHAWQLMHPPVQAHDRGLLDVGDRHRIHWEVCGQPGAPAALFVHGGPGAGCSEHDRRWFDPRRWRIVLFDQRGCGRSQHRGVTESNTTAHLLADMEALRRHLGISRWLLFGGSWGATLALSYAQAHPQRVSGLVLRGVFTATRAERDWLWARNGAAQRHPQAWQRLSDGAGLQPGQRLIDAMHDRLQADDAAALEAARAWWHWEQDLMEAETTVETGEETGEEAGVKSDVKTTGPAPPRTPPDDAQVLAAARIGVHYARHDWFLDEGQLLARAPRLRDLPAVIVQGQLDLVTPPAFARALHAAWPRARLRELPAAGHASGHPAMARQLIAATASPLFTTMTSYPEMHHGRAHYPA